MIHEMVTSPSTHSASMGTASSTSLDNVSQLRGRLNADGIADLQVDSEGIVPKQNESPRSLKAALDGVVALRHGSSGSSRSESPSEEGKILPRILPQRYRGADFKPI